MDLDFNNVELDNILETEEKSQFISKSKSTNSSTNGNDYKLKDLIRMPLIVLTVLLLLILLLYKYNPSDFETGSVTIIISLDGFRSDYLNPLVHRRALTPNLNEIQIEGVHALELIPCFPSKTFPNHYSIVTGLYPESHGIIANDFYDPVFNEHFSLSDENSNKDSKWWLGEPIWATAKKAGLIAGSVFWPGSEVESVNSPDMYLHFIYGTPYMDRIDKAIEWIDLPKTTRPNLITMYFERIDTNGHQHGPTSPEVDKAIIEADFYIGELRNKLKERGIYEKVNIIIVSDHGMAEISPSRTVYIEDYLDLNRVTMIEWSPVPAIIPLPGNEDYVVKTLIENTSIPHVSFFKKENIPEHYHYKNSVRIMPIVGIVEKGWTLTSRDRELNKTMTFHGNHGFDNSLPSMHGIFYARGPAFKKNLLFPSIKNLEIYNLLIYSLGLNLNSAKAPNNGTFATVEFLVNPLYKRKV